MQSSSKRANLKTFLEKQQSTGNLNVILDGVLRLGPGATAVGAIRVPGEFHNVGFLETEDILESTTDGLQDILALGGVTGGLVSRDALANSPCPQTDTVESLTDVHDNTHDLVVIIILEGLANRSQLSVQPQIVDRYGALVLKRVRPLATVLVVGVFPLWPDALLEKVVVCLEAQFGGRCDVVLIRNLGQWWLNREAIRQINDRRDIRRFPRTPRRS